MNPKDMNQPSLRQLSKDLAYMATYMDRVCFVRTAEECRLAAKECTAYADEIDALRKENEGLREALAFLLPLREDGTVSLCALQRNFRLGYNQARRIADAIDFSTARITKESEASHEYPAPARTRFCNQTGR